MNHGEEHCDLCGNNLNDDGVCPYCDYVEGFIE
jgi:hypothetical protein